ncbi:MAG: protein translocase subunit SecD [Patescibacteria group bacterium]
MSKKFRPTGGTVTKASVRSKFYGIIALAIFCLLVVMPTYANRGIDLINKKANLGIPRLPDTGFNLGLDLQGGAHLIYEAKTEKIPSGDVASAVEGVRDVIERRVRGGLGVSEPMVQTTRIANSYRIMVDLPGVTDVNQAIKMIGETPILEFKEVNNEPARDLTEQEKKDMDAYNESLKAKAKAAYKDLSVGVPFQVVVSEKSDDVTSTRKAGGDLGFITEKDYPLLYAWAKTVKDGTLNNIAINDGLGFNIVKRIGEKDGETEISASHLLICYTGAQGCTSTSTKEQALAKINDIKSKINTLNFSVLAKLNSTEPGADTSGGDLGFFKKGQMVPEFENAVWNAATNTIVGPIETQFGYHLIYRKVARTQKVYDVARIFLRFRQKSDIVPPAEGWKFSGLSGKQLKRAEVTTDNQTGQVQVSLQFNDEGTKLFAEITGRNVGKQVAIYLDGQPISIPRVNEAITGGSAVINGSFSITEAKLLSQRLNSGALPVPVELLSQQKVDATLGADSLQKSFKAGIAGLILVMIFMTLYYRLPGLLSVGSLLLYTVLNLAIFKLLGVTLTLSGIAGFILSIGMAVDANVLVFERLKEELRAGKSLKAAMEEAFLRAWPSIRDGHVTTLISSLVLVWFGSGFVQGFAVVLGTGVLVSLFTAVTITRTIMRLVLGWFGEGRPLFFLGGKSVTK